MATRTNRTPNSHHPNSSQFDQPLSKSPNLYTKDFQKQKTLKQSTPRGSLARSKYKKNLQKKSNPIYSDQNHTLALLLKQNSQLRKEILELKVHQFYQFDDKKLKQLLVQVENLKNQLKKCKEQLHQTQQENDFLRRSNAELKAQVQKIQETKLYQKRYRQKTIKNFALSPRAIRQDEEMTQRIVQKPVILSPNSYQDFEESRNLMQWKSTTKKDRPKRMNQPENEYLLLLQSKQRGLEPLSPRNDSKPRFSTSPREPNEFLNYKSKRKHYLSKDQD